MLIELEKINNNFKIEVKKAGSTKTEIEELQAFFIGIDIPNEYTDFISKIAEAEILVKNDYYIRIWDAKGCMEMNESYNIQKYIPSALAIGDDEGGQAIFYAKGNHGYGLYKVGFGNLDINDAVFIAPSLHDLLINGVGIEQLV